MRSTRPLSRSTPHCRSSASRVLASSLPPSVACCQRPPPPPPCRRHPRGLPWARRQRGLWGPLRPAAPCPQQPAARCPRHRLRTPAAARCRRPRRCTPARCLRRRLARLWPRHGCRQPLQRTRAWMAAPRGRCLQQLPGSRCSTGCRLCRTASDAVPARCWWGAGLWTEGLFGVVEL